MTLTPAKFYKLGMHPLAPRWFKVWCLKMIIRYCAKEIGKRIAAMTPEQRSAFDAAMAKHGKLEA